MSEVFEYANSRLKQPIQVGTPYVGVENLAKNRGGLESIGTIPNSGSAIEFKQGDVLIGNIRPYLKKIWLADFEGGTNGDVLPLRIRSTYSSEVDPRFAYQWLSSDSFFEFAVNTSKGAKMPRGDKAAIMEYKFPLVSREIQRNTLKVLESFEQLTTDIEKGIPAEITARRKQYEYYRDKLLTFKELEVA